MGARYHSVGAQQATIRLPDRAIARPVPTEERRQRNIGLNCLALIAHDRVCGGPGKRSFSVCSTGVLMDQCSASIP